MGLNCEPGSAGFYASIELPQCSRRLTPPGQASPTLGQPRPANTWPWRAFGSRNAISFHLCVTSSIVQSRCGSCVCNFSSFPVADACLRLADSAVTFRYPLFYFAFSSFVPSPARPRPRSRCSNDLIPDSCVSRCCRHWRGELHVGVGFGQTLDPNSPRLSASCLTHASSPEQGFWPHRLL
jgi:hypothetical protein